MNTKWKKKLFSRNASACMMSIVEIKKSYQMKFPLWIRKRVKMTVTRESPNSLYLSYKHFTLALISISHSPREFFHTLLQNFSISSSRGKTFFFVTIISYLLFWCSHIHTFSILWVLSVLWKWKNFSIRLMWFYFIWKYFLFPLNTVLWATSIEKVFSQQNQVPE